jgi:hypothetical protein
MATFFGLFVKNRAKNHHDNNEDANRNPEQIGPISDSRRLPSKRPDAIQFVLVNSAVLGCLQFLLDPTHKFPHRSGKWFSKL